MDKTRQYVHRSTYTPPPSMPLIRCVRADSVMPPQVEQEAEELNKLRRKLVMRVEDVLEQEFKASSRACT